MALKLGDLLIDIKVDGSELKKADRDVNKTSTNMVKAFTRVGGAIAAAFSVRAVAQVIMIADEMQVLERRIAVISDNAVQAGNNMARLTQIATRAGQRIGAVTQVFEGFKLIQSDIKATNSELLGFTEALTQLAVIGGSGPQQTSDALRQLNQGLTGGVLRAEEFNSIIENTPRIAEAIAIGLGKSLGDLRQMVLAGEVLSKDVFEAILGQTDEIAEKFKEIPQSLAQLFQGAKNEMAVFVAQLDDSIGATKFLADAFGEFRDNLAEINRRNAQLDKAGAVEALRRLAIQDQITQGLRDQIIHQKQIIQAEELRLEKARRAGANSMGQISANREIERLLVLQNESMKVAEVLAQRVLDLQAEETREAQNKLDIIEDEADAVERKLFANSRNLEVERAANQEARLAFTTAPTPVTPVRGPGGRRFAGAGGADDPLAPQAFGDPDIAGQSAEFLASLGDRNSQIELEAQRHEEALSQITTFGTEERAALQTRIDEKIAADRMALQAQQLSVFSGFLGQMNNLIVAAGGEGTAAQKAIAVAQALIQAQQIIAAGEVAAAKAAAFSAGAGPIAALTSAQALRTTSRISAGIVLGLSFGAGRQTGGTVGGNQLTPVNENGDPELFVQGGRQFLLPGGKGGKVVSGRELEAGGTGSASVTIINAGPPLQVTGTQQDGPNMKVFVKQAVDTAVAKINRSISSNQGPTAQALESAGFSRRR
jgi:tape measure domain-containing protein